MSQEGVIRKSQITMINYSGDSRIQILYLKTGEKNVTAIRKRHFPNLWQEIWMCNKYSLSLNIPVIHFVMSQHESSEHFSTLTREGKKRDPVRSDCFASWTVVNCLRFDFSKRIKRGKGEGTRKSFLCLRFIHVPPAFCEKNSSNLSSGSLFQLNHSVLSLFLSFFLRSGREARRDHHFPSFRHHHHAQ